MWKKLIVMSVVLVVCMTGTASAQSLKVEINRENTPAGWYAIEGDDIWSQGGQDVSFTFNGTDLGDVTIGIKNNTALPGIGLAVEHGWDGGYEPAGDLTDVAQDGLIIVCDPDGGCSGAQAADISLSFSGLLPNTV